MRLLHNVSGNGVFSFLKTFQILFHFYENLILRLSISYVVSSTQNTDQKQIKDQNTIVIFDFYNNMSLKVKTKLQPLFKSISCFKPYQKEGIFY